MKLLLKARITIFSKRIFFLLTTTKKSNISGEQGTAKTVMVKSFMSTYDSDLHINKSFNFSSASTPFMVQVKYPVNDFKFFESIY